MRWLFATLERVADGAQPLRLGDAVGHMRRLGLEQPDLDRSTVPALVPWRRRGCFRVPATEAAQALPVLLYQLVRGRPSAANVCEDRCTSSIR